MLEPERYSIIFHGDLRAGVRRSEVLKQISLMTNIDTDELLDSLFSVKPVVIAQVEGRELAETYLEAFQDAGLNLCLEPYCAEHDEITNANIVFSHYAPIARQDGQPNYLIAETTEEDSRLQHKSKEKSGPVYRITFSGKLGSGVSKSLAISNICSLTRSTSEDVIEQLFSVVPVILFETIDPNLAKAYLKDFSDAGLEVLLTQEPECSDGLTISQLRVREDIPSPPAQKRTPCFVYILSGLTLLCTLLWGAIYLFYKGYFDQDPVQPLAVKLRYTKQPSLSEPIIIPPEPIEEKITQSKAKPEPVRMDPKPSETVQQLTASATPPKINTTTVEKKPLSNTSPLPNKRAQIEQQYFLELLTWFARPEHQAYDNESRKQRLEGDIKIQITIRRDGGIKDIAVLSSTSEQLTDITRRSALNASPYPAVPQEIPGETYRFTLPLKYTLEDGP